MPGLAIDVARVANDSLAVVLFTLVIWLGRKPAGWAFGVALGLGVRRAEILNKRNGFYVLVGHQVDRAALRQQLDPSLSQVYLRVDEAYQRLPVEALGSVAGTPFLEAGRGRRLAEPAGGSNRRRTRRGNGVAAAHGAGAVLRDAEEEARSDTHLGTRRARPHLPHR